MNAQIRRLTFAVLLFCILLIGHASPATANTPPFNDAALADGSYQMDVPTTQNDTSLDTLNQSRNNPNQSKQNQSKQNQSTVWPYPVMASEVLCATLDEPENQLQTAPITDTNSSVFVPLVIQAEATTGTADVVAAADPECETVCDCPQGEFCYYGTCISDPMITVYCCAKPGCKPGNWCITPEGGRSRCEESPDYVCETACDCGPAHACMEVPDVGQTCVKDADDPWYPGASIFNVAVPTGEPTYCCADPSCHAAREAYGSSPDFACYDPFGMVIRDYCGGNSCYYAGDCAPGESCVDTRLNSTAAAGASCSSEGGFCVSQAIAESVYGWSSADLLPACGQGCFPGHSCEVGWRPGGSYAVQRVIGICGSCGNALCEEWESPVSCPTDCNCGDGVCSGTELISGSCQADCGTCGDSTCTFPETPKNCPADCAVAEGDGSCSSVEIASGLLTDCGCPESFSYWDYPAMCGDGVCQQNGDIPETYANCEQDCSDTTPPDIFATLAPAMPDGNNGWYRSDVSLVWAVTELESPDSLVKTGCADQSVTTDQDETGYACSAVSQGGSAGPVMVTIKRDGTPPDVAVTVVNDGGEYLLGTAPTAGCSTTDALSGVFTEATPAITGGTALGVGTFTATCAGAEDFAGNQAIDVAATYNVVFDFSGFFPPIYGPTRVNKVQAGSAVPVKFSLTGDQGLAILASGSPASAPISCDDWSLLGAAEPTETTGRRSLSYDMGEYVYVWKTDKTWAGSCRQLQVTFIDGKTYTASFQFQ